MVVKWKTAVTPRETNRAGTSTIARLSSPSRLGITQPMAGRRMGLMLKSRVMVALTTEVLQILPEQVKKYLTVGMRPVAKLGLKEPC